MAATRRWGVRARTTALAVLLAAAVLTLSAVLLLRVTGANLEAALVDDATERAGELAALAAGGDLPDPLPGTDAEVFAQVLDSDGAVVAADARLTGLGPLAGSGPTGGPGEVARVDSLFSAAETEDSDLVADGPYAVVTRSTGPPGDRGVVVVAVSLDDAAVAVAAATPVALIGIPVLTAAVGAITWWLTGVALRPVERMRVEAERISAADPGRRLPVPGSADEIRALAVTLNAMLGRLEASAAEQRRFVADASHELKSPLTTLGAIVDVTRRGADDAELAAVMDDVGAEVDRLQRLVADLVLLARHDEAGLPVERGDVDLGELTGEEAASLRRRGVAVDTAGVVPIAVRGDRRRLEQVLRNLTDNAARHAATMVWLETGSVDGNAVMTVSDDGPGIAETDRERVFDRFARLDESRARGSGGTGLGLAVARAIARGHGGDVVAVEPRHGGATLEVRIPLEP